MSRAPGRAVGRRRVTALTTQMTTQADNRVARRAPRPARMRAVGARDATTVSWSDMARRRGLATAASSRQRRDVRVERAEHRCRLQGLILRPFQARPRCASGRLGPVAPSWTTSTEIGTAAKASPERSRSHGTVTVTARLCPAATVGSAVVSTVPAGRLGPAGRPVVEGGALVRPHVPAHDLAPRGGAAGRLSGAVDRARDRDVLAGAHHGGDRVSRTMTATSLTGVTAGRCVERTADVPAYVVGTPGRRRGAREGAPDREPHGRQRRRGGGQACARGGSRDARSCPDAATLDGSRRPRQPVPRRLRDAAFVGEGELRCTSSSRIHATSIASWSGSFSMESSPPVASRR